MPIFKEGRKCLMFGRICTRGECQGRGKEGLCVSEVKKYVTRAEFVNPMTSGDINLMANVTYTVMSNSEAKESAKKLNVSVNEFKNVVINAVSVAQNARR